VKAADALEDMRAGRTLTHEMRVGIRASLRVTISRIDQMAEAIAPKGKRTNAVDRHTAEVLRGLANELDEWMQSARRLEP
jgi:hypothetical protein